jgi:hypothetical protein
MRDLRDVDHVDYGGHDVLSHHQADRKDKPPTSSNSCGKRQSPLAAKIAAVNGSSHWIQQL